MKRAHETKRRAEAGFSLMELIVAMGVTVAVMGLAATQIAGSFNVRNREDRKTDAIADVRRSLNTMTREIANGGYGLDSTYPANGIVAADSNNTQIRVLSNADHYTGGATPNAPTSADEDVIEYFVNDTVHSQRYVVHYDVNTGATTIMANRIDSFIIRYYNQKVVYTTGNCDISNVTDGAGTAVSEVSPGQATFVVLSICVQLPAVSTPGSTGYQPATVQQLTSDVQLRNATISAY
jgi:type II secretory pathway pseudopilin PulG